MNLPEVHERTMIVQEAEALFGMKIIEIKRKYPYIRLHEAIQAFSQCIVNLTTNNKVVFSDFQKDIEQILEDVSKEYELTFGEKVKLLVGRIEYENKFVIRWERHRDLSKEGDVAY